MPGKYHLVVDQQGEESTVMSQSSREKALVAWVMNHVDQWKDYRDSNFKTKWDEYYRLWRGIWSAEDRSRKSERSRLISPALQQAIESTVAELEEATFGKGYWFDVSDDATDAEKEDWYTTRNLLACDFEEAEIEFEISKVFLNGTLYGTGIGKLLVEHVTNKQIVTERQEFSFGAEVTPAATSDKKVLIKLEAIQPENFAIDPQARTIEEALGCAHQMLRPRHGIVAKQEAGIYHDVPVGRKSSTEDVSGKGETKPRGDDNVEITEYYGLVPKALLEEIEEDHVELIQPATDPEMFFDDSDLVEAVITIANGSTLLRDIKNPYLMKDRPIIAYQHDVVPNRFWGRGVAEKGYNPQKALDAEMRTRMDAMALSAHPMLAADASRMYRGQSLTVSPGKVYLTNGDPSTVFAPVSFPAINAATFHQSGDLERMVQMGTGAMDSATPTSINPRNQTASGMSMMQAAVMKRNKRAKYNIDRNFLNKLIEKALHRYMQFAPERYQVKDYKFRVRSTMGIMAREYEQLQLTQLLSVVPQDSPVFNVLVQGIFENSSLENKGDLMEALMQAQQPDPQAQELQQTLQQLEIEKAVKENQKLDSEIMRNLADAQSKGAKVEAETFNAVTNRLNAVANMMQEKSKEKSE